MPATMSFNHHMMTLAREARGLTQMELAARLDLEQGTLSKYETGFHTPPDELMAEIAEKLGFPAAFFFEPGIPYALPPFHYRRRKKLSAKTLGTIGDEHAPNAFKKASSFICMEDERVHSRNRSR
jgi:transcriptional regulator with XRE-family HTH domain